MGEIVNQKLGDDDWMPFGRYGPRRGDARRLRDVPAAYLLHLSSQDWLYQWPALGDYIEEKFFAEQARPAPMVRKPKPAPKPFKDDATLRDFLKTL